MFRVRNLTRNPVFVDSYEVFPPVHRRVRFLYLPRHRLGSSKKGISW